MTSNYDYGTILLIAAGVSTAIALGLAIYGYKSFLHPKNNGIEVNPTKKQETTGYLLISLPWIIPFGLYAIYLNREKPKSNNYLSGSDGRWPSVAGSPSLAII